MEQKVSAKLTVTTKGVDQANKKYDLLNKTGQHGSKIYGSYMNQLKKTNNKLQNITKDANRANTSFTKLHKTLNQNIGRVKFVAIGYALGNSINSAMDMVEQTNLFNIAMGKNAETADVFIQNMHDAFGFDVTNLRTAVGTFGLLAGSMGMTGKQSEVLSTNTAKLAYDLSSLTNVPIAQTMQDLRSGLVGQSETMYKYGVDVTEASLKTEALAQGITKSVRNMSQGEKMALRYAVMIKQTTMAHGDFARTINTPANQMKILGERFVTLSRSIGSIFIPMLERILPILNAIVQILIDVADAVASAFGFEKPSANNSIESQFKGIEDGADDASSSIDGATKSLKKMKDVSLGMDELNVITPPTPATGSGVGAGGGASILSDMDLTGYDNWIGKIQEVGDRLKTEVLAVMKNILIVAGLIAGTFLLWKLGMFISELRLVFLLIKQIGVSNALATIFPNFGVISKGLLPLIKNIGACALIVGGLFLAFTGIKEILTESEPSWKSYAKTLGGFLLIAGGIFLIFGGIPALVALAIGAVATLGLWIYKNWEDIKKWASEKWTAIKDTVSGAFESMKEKASDGVSAMGEKISSGWNTFKDVNKKMWKDFTSTITDAFTDLPYKIGYAIGTIIGTLAGWRENMIGWVKENIPKIIDSIIEFFTSLPSKIKEKFESIRDAFVQFHVNAILWIAETVPKIIDGIVNFFSELPNKIKEKFDLFKTTLGNWVKDAIGWIKTEVPKIINSISDWFSKLPNVLFDTGANMIKGLWNGILSVGTWLYSKIAKYFGKMWDIASSFFGGLGAGTKESYKKTKKYATGGFPDSGNMFIANEAGAEMVGSIGGKTAVVNNDQIVEAVSNGVARAVASVMGKQNEQPLIINLDGEVIYKNQQKVASKRGHDFGMGVFAR